MACTNFCVCVCVILLIFICLYCECVGIVLDLVYTLVYSVMIVDIRGSYFYKFTLTPTLGLPPRIHIAAVRYFNFVWSFP